MYELTNAYQNAFCTCLHSVSFCTQAQSMSISVKMDKSSLNQISMFYVTVSFEIHFNLCNISVAKLQILHICPAGPNTLLITTTSCFWCRWLYNTNPSSTIYSNIQILSKGKVYSTVFIFEMYLCWYWRLNWVDTL